MSGAAHIDRGDGCRHHMIAHTCSQCREEDARARVKRERDEMRELLREAVGYLVDIAGADKNSEFVTRCNDALGGAQ